MNRGCVNFYNTSKVVIEINNKFWESWSKNQVCLKVREDGPFYTRRNRGDNTKLGIKDYVGVCQTNMSKIKENSDFSKNSICISIFGR